MRLAIAMSGSVLLAASGALASAGAQLPWARAGPPDLVLLGGRVFTADSTRPWAEALAITGERITAVGTTAEIRALAGPITRTLALQGRTVIPGLNDAHDHLGGAEPGVRFVVDRSPVPDPSFAEVLDSLKRIVKRTPRDTWLVTDLGPRILDDRLARRAAIDRVAPDHPVMLRASWGHGMVLNSRALRMLGIDEGAENIAGGRYDRDQFGNLTGLLEEYAHWDAQRRSSGLVGKPKLVAALRARALDRARLGITTVQSLGTALDPLTTLRVFREAKPAIRVRIVPFPIPGTRTLRADEWRGLPAQLSATVTSGGRKWIVDGTPLERLAFMRAPYSDHPEQVGRLDFDPRTLRLILNDALRQRQQIMLHVVGDSAIRVVLATMKSLASESVWRSVRPRIEHGDFIAPDLFPLAKRLGVVLVQNPTHLALGDVMRQRYGARADSMMPLRSVLEAGIPVALGSDGGPSPWLDIMLATMHPLRPSEALTREQAIIAYTRGAAYAEMREHEKGTIAPGMLADIAVLSQDVFTVSAEALPATTSVLTIVGGQVVVRR